MRVIVRRERPHPGAQLSLFEEADGWRYTPFATNTGVGALQWLEARHRAHARVEDRIVQREGHRRGRAAVPRVAINQACVPPRPTTPPRPASTRPNNGSPNGSPKSSSPTIRLTVPALS